MKRLVLALSAVAVGLVVSSCAVGVRGSATEVTQTSATLNGKVLSTTGGPGSWYIEYGPAGAGSTEKTPTRTIDFVANQAEPVSEPVDELEPGTTYRFAVCAEDSENPGDPFCSPDQIFTTDFDPETSDSVTGTGTFFAEDFGVTVTHEYSVFSGPSGENASGTFAGGIPGEMIVANVTCLHVSGNRAVIGLQSEAAGPLYVVVVDGGASGPDMSGPAGAPDPVTGCASFNPAAVFEPYTGGDIVIHDAPASSSS